MIPGDEGKPMSIMERISDAPCEAEPFIDYMLKDYSAHRDRWAQFTPNDDVSQRHIDSVTHWLKSFVFTLEDIKMKMHRHDPPAPRAAQRAEGEQK